MKTLRDIILSLAMLVLAYYVSASLVFRTGNENSSTLIFCLAVVAISRYTEGYLYGIVSCIISTFCINYFFMYPYWKFNLTIAGYPMTMASLLVTSVVISTLTAAMKKQSEQNEILYKKQAEMRIETEREKMRSNLLRAVSHDLRTPLTGILGASSVILENQDNITREETVQFAQNIKDDTQWLINIVENLLSVTHMQEKGADIKKRDEVFEEIISESVQKVKGRFPHCKIAVNLPDEILVVPMDSILIQQVIINFIENAIKHSGANDIPFEVSMYREERGGRQLAFFQLRDYGKGIGFENIDKLIENVTMNAKVSSDATRGSGLGLSVCKSIVKAHNGIIEAQNAEEGGAIFRFGLEVKEVLAYE